MLPVYPPVYASISGYVLTDEMSVKMQDIRGTMELRVPCSATELPARLPLDSSSKHRGNQRAAPAHDPLRFPSTLRTFSVRSGACP
jgi:hypothetical protein